MPDFWEGTNVQIRVKCALLDGRKISSVGRAAPLHGDGQEFESLIFHHKIMLARAVLCSSGFSFASIVILADVQRRAQKNHGIPQSGDALQWAESWSASF